MTDLDAIKLHSMAYERGKTDTLDQVLEILDEIDDYQVIKFGSMAYGDGKDELRRRILALKG